MPFRAQPDQVLTERLTVEFLAARRGVTRVLLRDHEVEFACPDGGERALGFTLRDLHSKRRMLEGEQRQRLRDDPERRRLEHRESHSTRRGSPECRELGLEQLDALEECGGVLDQQFRRRG
jgi:hypothetical protein